MPAGQDDGLGELLENSIELELNVSDLYGLYSEYFEVDRDFWWRMCIEEKNHAALLKSGRVFLQKGLLPADVVHRNLADIKKAKEAVRAMVVKYTDSPPAMEEAYRSALEIELSAAEAHYERLMSEETDSKVMKIFQRLGMDDRDHANRLRELLIGHGMDA